MAMLAGAGIILKVHSRSEPPAAALPDVLLNASLSCGDGNIQVTNNDTAGWRDARVEINSQYARIIPAMSPGQTVTLPAAALTDSNGKSFGASMTCRSAEVRAFIHGAQGHYTQSFPH